MTKHMQWEASRKTYKIGATTVTEIELTPEARKRLTLKKPWQLYDPPDYDRMPTADRWLIAGIFGIMGCLLGALTLVVMYLVWADAKGVP